MLKAPDCANRACLLQRLVFDKGNLDVYPDRPVDEVLDNVLQSSGRAATNRALIGFLECDIAAVGADVARGVESLLDEA